MNQAPPKIIQHRFIQMLLKGTKVKQDDWEHPLAVQWVDAVKEYIESEERALRTVPPIFEAELNDDNIYVGEKNWAVLASWYGLDRNYACRRRPTNPSYVSVCETPPADHQAQMARPANYILADIKLDFVLVWCCYLKDLAVKNKHKYVSVYFWDSLQYIEFQVRCALKLHPRQNARLWLSLSDDGNEVFLQNVSALKNMLTPLGCILCLNYPDVMEALNKRQALPRKDQIKVVAGSLSQADSSSSVVKEELLELFLSNQWQISLCLEVLPSQDGPCLSSVSSNVPAIFQSVPIDPLFQCSDTFWDETLKQVIAGSAEEFNRLILKQKEDLFSRTDYLFKEIQRNYKIKEAELQSKMEEFESKDAALIVREKELHERDHELNSKLAKFKGMLTEFLTNKDKFEKEVRKMEEQNKITRLKVDLNVGGIHYSTSVATLIKEDSLLRTMFSGKHALEPDKDGSYFIDRDGTHFRHILNCLRDGMESLQHLPYDDKRLLSELRSEAEYFQLQPMVDFLKSVMSGSHGAYASFPM